MSISEEDSAISQNSSIEEKKFLIETDKNRKMNLFLRIYNNEEFSISIYTKKEYPSRKFEFRCNLKEIQKNRFFKIFVDFDEIMREIEDKIKNSTFIEEENDVINMEIPVGLVVIKNINLSIKLVEKTIQEINDELKNKIQELTNKIQEQKEEIKNLKNQMKELNNHNNNLKIQINEKDEVINKLREEKEQIENAKISNKNKIKIKLQIQKEN